MCFIIDSLGSFSAGLIIVWLNVGFHIYKVVMMVPDLTEMGMFKMPWKLGNGVKSILLILDL